MKLQKAPGWVGALNRNQPVKAYNMAVLSDDSAEINMYGDVVAIVPKDWRNGERLPGYIGLDEFLEDLEEIKDKNSITVHINSGGGDLYAGLAIYNRLKSVKGTVITINDGMAASAASLIFQAGDVRKMNAGSNFMAHGVAGFLFGYYNADDLKELVTQFKAHNKAVVNVYAERMGVSYDEAKHFVEGETWLTGQEAVEKGLADEVIREDEGEEDGEKNSLFGRFMQRARGTSMLSNLYGIPENNVSFSATAPVEDKNKIERSTDMEIKNIEELRAAFPELLAQAENTAMETGRTAGIAEERARIQGIEAIENAIADKKLVAGAKYGEKPITAEQLALQAMQAQAAIGANILNEMKEDAKESGAKGVAAAPNSGAGPAADDAEAAKQAAQDAVNLFKMMKNGGKK